MPTYVGLVTLPRGTDISNVNSVSMCVDTALITKAQEDMREDGNFALYFCSCSHDVELPVLDGYLVLYKPKHTFTLDLFGYVPKALSVERNLPKEVITDILTEEHIHKLAHEGCVADTLHFDEMRAERQVAEWEVDEVLKYGEIIERDPNTKNIPSCLLLRFVTNSGPVHIYCGVDITYIKLYTVYRPNEKKWEPDMKTRKRRDIQ